MTNSDSVINYASFPSPFVWWSKVKNHSEIKSKYLPLIDVDFDLNRNVYDKNNTWACQVTSSFFNGSDTSPIFDTNFYNSVVWDCLDKMLEELSKKLYLPVPIESRISRIWYNKYDPGSWQEIHDHSPCFNYGETFSGIYLLDLNESNGTVFYQQSKLRCFSQEYSHRIFTDHIEDGCVILFPSELAHYVKPSVNSRTTVSFNIASKYGDIPSN